MISLIYMSISSFFVFIQTDPSFQPWYNIIYPFLSNWRNKFLPMWRNKSEGGKHRSCGDLLVKLANKMIVKMAIPMLFYVMHQLFKWIQVDKNICNALIRCCCLYFYFQYENRVHAPHGRLLKCFMFTFIECEVVCRRPQIEMFHDSGTKLWKMFACHLWKPKWIT